MGLLSVITGPFVYMDANIFIYTLEGFAAYIDELTALFTEVNRGTFRAVTSDFTLAETLVKPLMDQNIGLQEIYHQTIRNSDKLIVVSVNRRVLAKAAQIRAETGLRLPDAIHAATCLLGSCETFLTNDPHFKRVAGLNVIVLSEVISP